MPSKSVAIPQFGGNGNSPLICIFGIILIFNLFCFPILKNLPFHNFDHSISLAPRIPFPLSFGSGSYVFLFFIVTTKPIKTSTQIFFPLIACVFLLSVRLPCWFFFPYFSSTHATWMCWCVVCTKQIPFSNNNNTTQTQSLGKSSLHVVIADFFFFSIFFQDPRRMMALIEDDDNRWYIS